MEIMKERLKNKIPYRAISEEFNFSTGVVARIKKQLFSDILSTEYYYLILKKIYLTEKGLSVFEQRLLKEKKSQAQIAKEFCLSEETIAALKKKHFSEYKIDNRRRFFFQEDVFSKIDSPEKAYWLGFLAADASVHGKQNCLALTLQQGDRSHIEKFAKFISLTEPEEAIKNYEYNGYFRSQLTLYSHKLKHDLSKLGVTPNKTFTYCFPTESQVPSSLIDYFILGYIDADGCIFVFDRERNNVKDLKISITGTHDVVHNILKRLSYNPDPNKIKLEHNCHDTYKIVLYKKETLDFLKRVYPVLGNTPLERKHNTYNEYNSSLR